MREKSVFRFNYQIEVRWDKPVYIRLESVNQLN